MAVVLAWLSIGCAALERSRDEAPAPGPAMAPPSLWVEAEPSEDADHSWAVGLWLGVWTEYVEGRSVCQDRFTITPGLPPSSERVELRVRSRDCATDLPYEVRELRWDGRQLAFLAVSPTGQEIRYRVELEGPERIVGRADGEPVFWSRTQRVAAADHADTPVFR